jgi:hypothetical protein
MPDIKKLMQAITKNGGSPSSKQQEKNKEQKKEPAKAKKDSNITVYKGGKEKTPTGESNAFEKAGISKDSVENFAKKFNLPMTSNKDLQDAMVKKLSQTEAGRKKIEDINKKYGETKAGTLVDNLLGARTVDMMSSISNEQKVLEDSKRLSGLMNRFAQTRDGKYYSFKDANAFGNYISKEDVSGGQEIPGEDVEKLKKLFPNKFNP